MRVTQVPKVGSRNVVPSAGMRSLGSLVLEIPGASVTAQFDGPIVAPSPASSSERSKKSVHALALSARATAKATRAARSTEPMLGQELEEIAPVHRGGARRLANVTAGALEQASQVS